MGHRRRRPWGRIAQRQHAQQRVLDDGPPRAVGGIEGNRAFDLPFAGHGGQHRRQLGAVAERDRVSPAAEMLAAMSGSTTPGWHAIRTSWPAACNAHATGTTGCRCAVAGKMVNKTRMSGPLPLFERNQRTLNSTHGCARRLTAA